MKRTAPLFARIGLLCCLAAAVGCSAQPVHGGPAGDHAWLTRTITYQEDALSRTYNTCSLHRLRARLFEGTMIELPDGRQIEPVKEARERICGRLRREVRPGSLVVRPVGDDSALVTGEQRFCAVGAASCTAAHSHFATVWTRYEGTWRMGRMLRLPSQPDA